MINFSTSKKLELAQQLGSILGEMSASVTTVESCTGGGVAQAITEVPGSSGWFHQAWVTYSNDAKQQMVGVQASTLEQYGAVSEEVVIEMAQGGLKKAGADYCVSISGVAGPDGGTKEKPVGLVWFAIASKQDIVTFKRGFSGDRLLVREQAIAVCLEKLIESIAN